MITDNQVLVELQKINKNLSQKNSFKVALNGFLSGFFNALGYLVATIATFLILAYFAAQFNWAALVSKSVETTMSQIDWSKIVPTYPSSRP